LGFAPRGLRLPCARVSMKILLADDDEISRKIIASFLARFGY
jgi:CheY-like chemotaxis protein